MRNLQYDVYNITNWCAKRVIYSTNTPVQSNRLEIYPKGKFTFALLLRKIAPLYSPLWCRFCILGHQRRSLCARCLGRVSLTGFSSLHFLPLCRWDVATLLSKEKQQQKVWIVFLSSVPGIWAFFYPGFPSCGFAGLRVEPLD